MWEYLSLLLKFQQDLTSYMGKLCIWELSVHEILKFMFVLRSI